MLNQAAPADKQVEVDQRGPIALNNPTTNVKKMLKQMWRALTKERGEPYWTLFLRATAVVGLVGIPLVTYFPNTVPLVWLWLVGIPANSPISPLFPTAFEPLMMEVVKYVPVLTTTLVATGIFVYMEFINWYVYSWVLNWDKFETVRNHKWVKWGVKHFARSPRATVLVFAATPIPFWVARCLAILHRMPFAPYMVVMAIGRFPRLLVYAWIGSKIQIPSVLLISFAVGTGILVIAWRLIRGQPLLQDTVLDRARPAVRVEPTKAAE